jgi:hypothetical protein
MAIVNIFLIAYGAVISHVSVIECQYHGPGFISKLGGLGLVVQSNNSSPSSVINGIAPDRKSFLSED